MTTQIFFGQIMGKYAGLSTAVEKQTYLYSDPQDNSQQNYVCIISELHCTLSPPPLCFSGRVNSRWREREGKKDYLCSDKKQPEREQKS